MLTPELVSRSTRHALKEWAVVVDSLRQGSSLVTVRKGGIREAAREFRLEQRIFTLFPTYEHQNPAQLQDRYANRLTTIVQMAPMPGWVSVDTWAEVTDVVEVMTEKEVRAASEFSVFAPSYAVERLQWRPRKPLHVLVLRVHRLAEAVPLKLLPEYGGCKSWIDLADDIRLEPSVPALDDDAYEAARIRILRALASCKPNSEAEAPG